MKIYVIRHGITELNKKKKVNGEVDEPLAPEGFEQTKAIIPLIPKSITHIYTSPLLRAKQTAEIISSGFDLPISIQDALTEIHMGSLAGKSWEEMEGGLELKKKHRAVEFNYLPYGGESVGNVKERVVAFLKKINNKHVDYEALVVTHGGIIRVLHFLERGEAVYETEEHVTLLTFNIDKILRNSKKVR